MPVPPPSTEVYVPTYSGRGPGASRGGGAAPGSSAAAGGSAGGVGGAAGDGTAVTAAAPATAPTNRRRLQPPPDARPRGGDPRRAVRASPSMPHLRSSVAPLLTATLARNRRQRQDGQRVL